MQDVTFEEMIDIGGLNAAGGNKFGTRGDEDGTISNVRGRAAMRALDQRGIKGNNVHQHAETQFFLQQPPRNFQLWHGDSSNWSGAPAKRYPLIHGTAARTDVAHALHWDRQQRIHIPELLVWHLESEPASMGANWKGRKTARFGPAAATNMAGAYVGV